VAAPQYNGREGKIVTINQSSRESVAMLPLEPPAEPPWLSV
jgi:hypothetical protein